jgi:hypothetical protein
MAPAANRSLSEDGSLLLSLEDTSAGLAVRVLPALWARFCKSAGYKRVIGTDLATFAMHCVDHRSRRSLHRNRDQTAESQGVTHTARICRYF